MIETHRASPNSRRKMALPDYMPSHTTTNLDRRDFWNMIDRIKEIHEWLDHSKPISISREQSSFISANSTLISFRRRNDGMQLRVDPNPQTQAFTFEEEALPNHEDAIAPQFISDAQWLLRRWIIILELPMIRQWGGMQKEENPSHAHAQKAGETLVAFNSNAVGATLVVPSQNHYEIPKAITTLKKTPVFHKIISDSLISAIPMSAHITDRDGRHDYHIGRSHSINVRCQAIDPMTRLRILKDYPTISKPLLKAGLMAGPNT